MGKVIVFNMTTLDGFFEGPKREIDWHHVDDEFNDFAIEQLNTVEALLFGRVTYEMMASYWPTPEGIKDDPIVASKMNNLPKFVFSKTLSTARWQNTKLIKENFAGEISKLKKQASKDMFIFGSSDLAVSFMENELIDEYRFIINPIILGGGKPIFKGISKRVELKYLKSRVFKNGNVLLYYGMAK